MTTIAFRDGVLAADSMAYCGKGYASPGSKWKIWRLKNGDRLGVSSTMVGAGEKIRDWLDAGGVGPRDELPADHILILVRGRDQVFIGNSSLNLSGPIETNFYAIGSGGDYALGAMQRGASAAEAVDAAIALDQHSGGPVRILGHE